MLTNNKLEFDVFIGEKPGGKVMRATSYFVFPSSCSRFRSHFKKMLGFRIIYESRDYNKYGNSCT